MRAYVWITFLSFSLFFPSRPIVWGRREVLSPVNHVVRMKIHQALQCTVGDGCYLLFLEGLLVDYAHRGRQNEQLNTHSLTAWSCSLGHTTKTFCNRMKISVSYLTTNPGCPSPFQFVFYHYVPNDHNTDLLPPPQCTSHEVLV